jgi:hypothetical protein
VLRPVNRIVYFFEHGLPGAIEFFKDAVGVRGPAVGFGIAIVMIQKAEDIGDQGSDAAKAPCADDLGCDFSKEAFHQIEPAGRGGNEMEVKTGMTLKPGGGDFGVLVSRVSQIM